MSSAGHSSRGVRPNRPASAYGDVHFGVDVLSLSSAHRVEMVESDRQTDPMDQDYPTGTVTFLMSDVEGSTPAWEAQADVMGPVMARLAAMIADAIAAHGGSRPVEQGEGDSAVGVFALPSAAVAAALDAQRAIAAGPWPPEAAPTVRVAVHTGEAYERSRGHYDGPAIIRCARIRTAAHGGQVLLSDVTNALVADRLPIAASSVDVGTVRLKGQTRRERLWQLCHPDLRRDFPPVRSLLEPPSNLPASISSFVGRRNELTELAELVRSSRLVTLTGSGGCGKTRLAHETARQMLTSVPGGLWWVELAGATADDDVIHRIGAAIGIEHRPGPDTASRVARHLSEIGADVLVVLDNCEHVLGGAAAAAQVLLTAVPILRIVTTSREPLGVPGEATWRVPSMTVSAPADTTEQCDAVRLFCERALAARPNLVLDETALAMVAHICVRLDGVPLALELAAARARTMPLVRVVRSLDETFRLLTGGPRTVVPRQQTMHASIDWSVDLLDEGERLVLHRLAVCAGGFDLDAAERIATVEAESAWDVLDLVDRLVDKSMVQLDGDRYRLLEVVRQHGIDRLRIAGELADARDRHADHFLNLVHRLAPLGSGDERGFDRLVPDWPNIVSAIDWGLQSRQRAPAFEAIGALAHHPLAVDEWRSTIARLRDTEIGDDELAWARGAASTMAEAAWQQIPLGDVPQRAEAIALAHADRRTATLARMATATERALDGDLAPLEAIIADARRDGLDEVLMRALQTTGAAETLLYSRFDTADVRFADVLDLAGRLGNRLMAGLAQGNRAMIALRYGRFDDAELWARSIGDLQAYGWLPVTVLAEVGLWRCSRPIIDGMLASLASLESDPFGLRGTFAAYLDLLDGRADRVLARLEPGANAGTLLSGEVLFALADCEIELGDMVSAQRKLERAVSVTGRIVAQWPLARALLTESRVRRGRGDRGGAQTQARRALELAVEAGFTPLTIDALELVALLSERPVETVRLAATAEAARSAIGYRWRWPADASALAEALTAARTALGPDASADADTTGAASSLPDSASAVTRSRGERGRPRSGWDALTPTETGVVELVAQGRTNDEIGAALLMGRATVRTHLNHVYAKLGVPNRAALAAGAARRQSTEHT